MIYTENKNGFRIISSDAGKKIRLKGTKDAHPKAVEPEDGKHYEYEEVEPDDSQDE